MNRKNKHSLLKYSAESLYWLAMSLFLYSNLLFCPLPGMDHSSSYRLFMASAIAGSLLGFLLTFRRRRNWLSVICSLAFAFGPYFLLTFWHIDRRPLLLAGRIAATLVIGYTLTVVCSYLHQRARGTSRASGWRCFSACLRANSTLCLLVLASLLAITVAKPLMGLPIMEAKPDSALTDATFDNKGLAISAHMDTVLLLEEDAWARLDVPARLQVMKTVADIEADYLGIDKLNVCTDVLPKIILGQYTHADRTVKLSLSQLSTATARTMLTTLCHECYHAYQHRLVDLYRSLDDEARQLILFQKIPIYRKEFANYINGREDYEAYDAQFCEVDSDDYADNAVFQYYFHIRQYKDPDYPHTFPRESDETGE